MKPVPGVPGSLAAGHIARTGALHRGVVRSCCRRAPGMAGWPPPCGYQGNAQPPQHANPNCPDSPGRHAMQLRQVTEDEYRRIRPQAVRPSCMKGIWL